jgi:hypothetical protein
MATIGEAASYVRSKNAGPFWMTIDIFCDKSESFDLIKNSKNLNQEAIARIYGSEPQTVKIFYLQDLNVIKISLPRSKPLGHRNERDMHSGQQYVQILDLEL